MFNVKTHKLKNGLTVLFCQTKNFAEFEISMHIGTGARHESNQNSGISHFLEHMMFRGSRYYPNSIMLARALEKFGGEINALTGMEQTTYWIKGDAEKLFEAIPQFAEFFLYPNFADIEVERNVILQELASDYNDQGVCVDVDHLAMKAMFNEHSLGNSILGTHDSIKKICIEDLHQKRQTEYIPSKCILTIYSPQNFDAVIKSIEQNFDFEWAHTQNEKSLETKKNLARKVENFYKKSPNKKSKNFLSLQNNIDNQYAMKVIFPTVGGLSEQSIHTVFLQRILDDGICTRLPGNIREQHGLAYDISCDTQFFYEIGVLGIDVTVSEDCFTDLLNKLAFELKSLFITSPTSEEVEHIKYRYLFDLKQIMQNPSKLLNRHANALFMDSNFSLQEEIEVVKNMNEKILHMTAQNTFVQNLRAFALIGPRAKKQRNSVEKFLKIFEH